MGCPGVAVNRILFLPCLPTHPHPYHPQPPTEKQLQVPLSGCYNTTLVSMQNPWTPEGGQSWGGNSFSPIPFNLLLPILPAKSKPCLLTSKVYTPETKLKPFYLSISCLHLIL